MKKMRNVLSHIYLNIAVFLSIFPLYWMFSSATNRSIDIIKGRMIPGTAFLENLSTVMNRMDLWVCLRNSIFTTVLSTLFCLVVCSLAGYSFEIYRGRMKEHVFEIFLMCMMIPSVVMFIPFYQMTTGMGLMNNLWAVILPAVINIYQVFLFRQNTKSFPVELVEAARIDGKSEIGIFFQIYVPLMRSTFATGFIILIINNWNSYMFPRLVLSTNENITMPILVALMSSAGANNSPDFGAIMLACTMCTLPVLILFLFLQKAFANGISGSIKG